MFGDLVQAQAKYDLMSKFAPDKAEQPGEVEDVASYKPEHSWNYEAGIHSELIRGRLSAELTLFYMDIRDIQLTSFAENGSGRLITNGGKANSYGLELSLRGRIMDGLTADLNYGFTHATFRDYIFTDKDENSQIVKTDCKDNFIPYTPRHTVSLGLQYTKLLHRKMIDQFTASAQFTGAGKIFWTEKTTSANRSTASSMQKQVSARESSTSTCGAATSQARTTRRSISNRSISHSSRKANLSRSEAKSPLHFKT